LLKNVRKRIYLGMILFSLVMLLANTKCYAEGAGDRFLYDVKKLPKDILIDTIGLIRLSNKEMKDGIQQYQHENNKFISKGILKKTETLPVGEGGYGGWYKYLVVDVCGEYIKIIYNPYKDFRVWIKPSKNIIDGHSLIVFDELYGIDLKTEKIDEIDIFILSKEIKLYKEPSSNSNYILVKKELQEKRVFYPIVFKKDFVLIGQEFFDEDTMETIFSEPIGWIKTRNFDGKITFYFYTCFWM